LKVDLSDDGNADEADRQNLPKINSMPVHPDAMVSSITADERTSVDQDVIEIHQFSVADIDAYLDIYFETLDNRLKHMIGTGDELEQFRSGMKSRILSSSNTREHENILLGKMHDEVVAAVRLTFSTEICTISNEQLSGQSPTCLTFLHRWMTAKANYHPADVEECYIEMIGVKSSHRSRGVGSAMLECVEHFAKQAGARILVIHASGDLQTGYFHRSGFEFDRSDNSAWWKSFVERQGIQKMVKSIASNDNNTRNLKSYVNGSMVDSLDQ
jgi:GNAT superfamily N-acetyltransferase